MKKYFNIIVALLIILQVCNINFTAIVSDNDGNTFVTKIEFDTLKKEFKSQIDNYNNSIDSKIDGAIAAYLAGFQKLSDTFVVNYYEKYKVPGSSGLAWANSSDYVDNTNNTQLTGWNINFEVMCSNGPGGTKYISYNTVKKDTYQKRIYFDDGKITGLYDWEPMMLGAGLVMSFSHAVRAEGTEIGIEDDVNGFNWYDGIILDSINRKDGITKNGGIFAVDNSVATEYNISYSERIKDSGAPFVISPKSDAIEYYINTADEYFWGDTLVVVDPTTDDSFTTTGWKNVFNATVLIGWGASGGTRMKGYVEITGKKRNEMIVKQFEDVCQENGTMKYGVVLTQATKNGNIEANVKCSGDGNVKLWAGNKTIDYTYSTKKATFAVTAGDIVPISLTDLSKGDYVRVIYEPVSDDVHTMDIFDLTLKA